MGIAGFIANKLRLPEAPVSISEMKSQERLTVHRSVLLKKPAFRRVALDIHSATLAEIEDRSSNLHQLPIIEIGAGIIPLSESSNNVVSTDIEISSGLGCVASATSLPFASNRIRALVGQNVFHHVPDSDGLIAEASRVLAPGGILILIEPYHGFFASLIYPALFSSEGFDKRKGVGELIRNSDGDVIPNQAISFSYFGIDSRHKTLCDPKMQIVFTAPLRSGIRYLSSGALNFRKVLPDSFLAIFRQFEEMPLIGRFFDYFAIHWMIVIQKVDSSSDDR